MPGDVIQNNHYNIDGREILRSLDHLHQHIQELNQKLIIMANSIQELTAKVDALQTALDTEQEQIAAAIAQLQQTVTDLQAIVAEGGTAEERQALADKLDSITADLQSTIGETPAPEA